MTEPAGTAAAPRPLWLRMSTRPTEAQPSGGTDEPMTAEQAALLRRLAHEAFDLDAFGEHLTRDEAARRIATLEAKLKLQDEPPHTL
jgi:hypothetical protein